VSTATLPTPVPEVVPEIALTEEVYGVIVEKPVSAASIWIANQIYDQLSPFVKSNRLGRTVTEGYFIMDRAAKLRRRPDVAFVSKERWSLEKALPFDDDWEVIPDLAIEVISPSNLMEGMAAKAGEYLRYGVREVWVVLPREQQIYVYDSPDHIGIIRADKKLSTSVVPGWELDLNLVFKTTA
jgi:Uma2 family endonuclease